MSKPIKGSKVEFVFNVKGRKNAAKKGEIGTVFWRGIDRFSDMDFAEYKIGVKIGDRSVFVPEGKVVVI